MLEKNHLNILITLIYPMRFMYKINSSTLFTFSSDLQSQPCTHLLFFIRVLLVVHVYNVLSSCSLNFILLITLQYHRKWSKISLREESVVIYHPSPGWSLLVSDAPNLEICRLQRGTLWILMDTAWIVIIINLGMGNRSAA
jgi:hypothetical protein